MVWDEDGMYLCTSAEPGIPKIGDKLTLNETCKSGEWWLNGTTGVLVHNDTGLCVTPPNLKDEFTSSYEEDAVLNTTCTWEMHQWTDWTKVGWKGALAAWRGRQGGRGEGSENANGSGKDNQRTGGSRKTVAKVTGDAARRG